MPYFCGLPCCSKKDPRHPEEKDIEKPAVVALPVRSSTTTASIPTRSNISVDKQASRPTAPIEETASTVPETNETTENTATIVSDASKTPTEQQLDQKEPVLPSNEPTTSPALVDNADMADSLKGAVGGLGNTVQSGAQQASSGVQSGASAVGNTASSGAEKASSGVQSGASTVGSTASAGAEKASSGAQSTAGTATGGGTKDWDAMTEEQKKQTFDALPEEKKKNLTYYEWVMQGYQHKKENWMPWIEDVYLRWFTSDNKASYAAKDTLDKSKVTGIEQVDNLQDGVNNLAAGQVGQGGLLQPMGDMVSKEGVNRAERGGKDDSGSYAGAVGGSVWSGAKSAGGYVGSFMPGGKKEESK